VCSRANNLVKPLDMHRSYFDATPYHLLRHRSQSYWLKDGKLALARFDLDTGVTVSNGGLNAPLPDMVKYLNFLLGDPRRRAVGDQLPGGAARTGIPARSVGLAAVERLLADPVPVRLMVWVNAPSRACFTTGLN